MRRYKKPAQCTGFRVLADFFQILTTRTHFASGVELSVMKNEFASVNLEK